MEMFRSIIGIFDSTKPIVAMVCLFFILLYLAGRKGGCYPWNWPVLGMLLSCFPVFVHVFDCITYVLKCTDGTFLFKLGPSIWFGKVIIFTSHPEDIRHIMSSNFWNYPKGLDTKLIFEAYGEFLFSTDHHEWREHREMTHAFLNAHRMHQFAPKVNSKILSEGLVPVLDHASQQGLVVHLQDVFKRFMLDATSMIATGYNHGSLRIGLPEDGFLTALHHINQGIFMRYVLPERLWKLQRWLGIGKQKELLEAWEAIDRIISKDFDRNTSNNVVDNNEEEKEEFNVIKASAHLGLPDEIRRDMVKILLFGGTDTVSSALTWFFLQVLENPVVENKIREEIQEKILSPAKAGICLLTEPEELDRCVYLHAAILETMRLYPPAPFHSRTSVEPDILPSGHKVSSGMKVAPCYYSMGRMESIWGEDCLQFKPERWISEKGKIIPVPANKFVAFGLGPRTCLGKILGLTRLKAAAATIIHSYDIQIIKNHSTTFAAAASIYLEMKHGLKARIKKRSTS